MLQWHTDTKIALQKELNSLHMTPTIKEKACIDLSIRYRESVVNREILKTHRSRGSIILRPKPFYKELAEDAAVEKCSLPKQMILYSMITAAYILFTPVNLVYELFHRLNSNRSNKKAKARFVPLYALDYTVSDIKRFPQLWADKGLQDWGPLHMHLSGFTDDEQLSCAYDWFCILYDQNKIEFNVLVEETKQKIREVIASAAPGIHVTPVDIVQGVVKQIDEKYGAYM